ncbi:MAG: hypothetical protein AAGF95_13195 [Chloroflexota bacterium]
MPLSIDELQTLPPIEQNWLKVVAFVEHLEATGALEQSLDRLDSLLARWPDELREAPMAWMHQVISGDAAKLRICKTFDTALFSEIPYSRTTFEQVWHLSTVAHQEPAKQLSLILETMSYISELNEVWMSVQYLTHIENRYDLVVSALAAQCAGDETVSVEEFNGAVVVEEVVWAFFQRCFCWIAELPREDYRYLCDEYIFPLVQNIVDTDVITSCVRGSKAYKSYTQCEILFLTSEKLSLQFTMRCDLY